MEGCSVMKINIGNYLVFFGTRNNYFLIFIHVEYNKSRQAHIYNINISRDIFKRGISV